MAIAAIGSFILTLVLAGSTVFLWLETKKLAGGAEDQSKKMALSIAEAARAANAMEGVARSMAVNAEQVVQSVATSKEISARQQRFGEMQMRAYVTVLIGGALYQEKKRNLRFECNPVLLNTGPTPAKNVRWRGRAAILPNPIPPNFKFDLPPERKGRSLLGPQQNGAMAFVVDDFVSENEVANVKLAQGHALYVWGLVTYDDVFGHSRRTTFAQQIYWVGKKPRETVKGWHLSKHNRVT